MIIRPFNAVHTGLFVFAAALILLLYFVLYRADENTRKWVMVSICAVNVAGFFLYKLALSHDAEFLSINGIERFNWWNELPLQLCNINMFLIPIGLLTKKRPILGFSFFVAPLGAVMALLFPEPAFDGFSLFLPRILGFYGTHIVIFICGISLATLGLYRPRLRDFPGIYLTLICLACGAHIVNLVLRHTVCPFANYFFTYPADISILRLFRSWIPVPLLYLAPGLVILGVYMLTVWLTLALPERIAAAREKKKEKKNGCGESSEE